MRGTANEPWHEVGVQRIEDLTRELFSLHDLNGNGMLEEAELITLNLQIAMLHHGKETDTAAVRAKYSELFRAKLDPEGRPVPYEIFRQYAAEVLDGLDNDPEAQEMILEQFVAEARSGREAFDLDAAGASQSLQLGPPITPEAPEDSDMAVDYLEAPPEGESCTGCHPCHSGPNSAPAVLVAGPTQDDLTSSEGSPASGRGNEKGTAAEDTAGYSTAASPSRGWPAAESSAEEGAGPNVEDGDGTGEEGHSTVKPCYYPLGATPDDRSDDTAIGDSPVVPRCRSDSSLDETPIAEGAEGDGSSMPKGTLVVEKRNVRRTSSCPPRRKVDDPLTGSAPVGPGGAAERATGRLLQDDEGWWSSEARGRAPLAERC